MNENTRKAISESENFLEIVVTAKTHGERNYVI